MGTISIVLLFMNWETSNGKAEETRAEQKESTQSEYKQLNKQESEQAIYEIQISWVMLSHVSMKTANLKAKLEAGVADAAGNRWGLPLPTDCL